MTNSKRTNPIKPPICINDFSRMAVISASLLCKSDCTFFSIWQINPRSCLLSSALRAARLSACSDNRRLCAFCSLTMFLSGERSVVVVVNGFVFSFLPNMPKNPLRFGFLGCSCTIFCTITGSWLAIFLLMDCCSSINRTIWNICRSLYSKRLRTLSTRSIL
ncbi:hypothetical protein IMSAGC016_01673 [Muribaculaceae bacterium]|nr:hypothetical protein IMSAGC016_01673 [Muribaculaceae bacterium]